ncbi:MAG: DUF3179 domain-containing protein [Bacteroidota bacterium]
MKTIRILGILGLALILQACDDEPSGLDNSSASNKDDSWSIPRNLVFDGGPGKDGIPALTNPEFIPGLEADYLSDDDLVLGFVAGDEARAYPHKILDWHEIINDQIGEVYISVTYCPLTGTGIGWNRDINGKRTTFGVSGLLYNSNLIPYDRETDSNWSQIRMDCVNGELKGTIIETFPMVETTWKTWQEMYPATRVVSTRTGHSRDYGRYPYGGYRTDHDFLIFPAQQVDVRLPGKERVHGIVFDDRVGVYPFSQFGTEVSVINDNLGGNKVVITGNAKDNFIVSFLNDPGDGTTLSFIAVQDQYPVVLTDTEGNKWDIQGRAVEGPRKGSRLSAVPSFMGYWFSFPAFYPDPTIYGDL